MVALRFYFPSQTLHQNQVVDAMAGYIDVDRLSEVIHCAKLQALCLGIKIRQGCYEHHRDAFEMLIGLETLTDLVTIHLRHHHIEENDVGMDFPCQFQSNGT